MGDVIQGIPFVNVRVAEVLEWDYRLIEFNGKYELYIDDVFEYPKQVDFTSWEGMGLLVETARKEQDIQLMFEPEDGGYKGRAWQFGWSPDTEVYESAPLAVALSFLKVNGVLIPGMD